MTHAFRLAGIALAGALSLPALAQSTVKPEQVIKWRQSAFQVIAWNNARIKTALDGPYNKDEVNRAANALAAIANAGLGVLFQPGTEQGKGWHETAAKPELFHDARRAAERSADFSREASELARVASTDNVALVKEQFARLSRTCKACHDDFRNKD